MNKVIFIFLDGVGIGKKDKEFNPFFKYEFKTFTKIFGSVPSIDNPFLVNKNHYLTSVDTCLGVKDLPQSGTGQTSIFCGINAAKYLGRHFGPYPHSSLHNLIKEKNLFLHLKKKGYKPFFANAYPEIYFNHINKYSDNYSGISVPTLCCLYSDCRLNNYDDLLMGNALSPEIDNHRWVENLKYNLPIISSEKAAENLLKKIETYDFILFEYFYTDYLGHGRLKESFDRLFNTLDNFLLTVLNNYDKNTTIIITTDHGNIEDLSTKSHTYNNGLLIISGNNAEKAINKIKDISQINNYLLDEIFV